MKRTLCIILSLIMALGCISLFGGCAKSDDYTIMQVDTNPSVEFVLDGDNKVVSVTALNADGEIIVAGEAFVGKSAEDAMELYLQICIDTGYIDDAETEEVTITVTAVSNANAIYNDVKAAAGSFLEESGINAAIEQGTAYTKAALEETMLLIDQTLTAAEVAEMEMKELLEEIAVSRQETKDLLSAELREMYYAAKAYNISFTEKEETKEIISGVAGIAATLMSAYSDALDSYQAGIAAVEKAKYDNFIDPECAYQKAIASLIEKKIEIVAKRQEIETLTNPVQKGIAEAALLVLESALTGLQTAITTAGGLAEIAFDTTIESLKLIEQQLVQIESGFPTDVQAALTAKAAEIETAMNQAKDDFYQDFETEYQAAITAQKERSEGYKDSMNDANDGTVE